MFCCDPANRSLLPETQSEASCSYSVTGHKKSPLKGKKMDLPHKDPEPQLTVRPKKARRTKTEKNTGRHPGKRGNSLQKENFLEHYTIGKWLGSGCYGNVHAGVRKSDEQKVAIKYLSRDRAEYFTPPGQTCTVPLEVVLMELVGKPCSSPYVIKLLEWFETPKGFFLVMEQPHKYITLYDFCKRLKGRVPENMARIIMWKVVQGALHCRNQGVLHRDIKEDNVLVNPETLDLKLIDFGYAYLVKNRCYKAFGGPPVCLPAEWAFKNYNCLEPATIWDLGVLLCVMTRGENPLYFDTPFFIKGLSDENYLQRKKKKTIKAVVPNSFHFVFIQNFTNGLIAQVASYHGFHP